MHYYTDLKINIVQRHDGLFYNAAGTIVYERDWIIEDEGQNFTDFLTGEH
nr:MAG: hypothetical protein [Bacteriophage sp.]